MKKLLVLLFFLHFYSAVSLSQPIANSLSPRVDTRVELLCIVFGLAKREGFTDNLNPKYSTETYKHFKQYTTHPLVIYVRKTLDSLQKKGMDIDYREVPGLAVHLSQPPALEPVVPFTNTPSTDSWDNRELLSPLFITLLQDFYQDAGCEAFFKTQANYYTLVNQAYESQQIKLNKKWITLFFSVQTTENYYAIIALGLRNGAYLRVNFPENRRNTFTVFGCPSFDSAGLPQNFSDPMYSRSMLHEYIHAFTNQMIDKNINELKEPAETILANPEVFKLVENTFYGNWRYLLYESLVRACSIKYMMVNKEIKPNIEDEIEAEEKEGFLWIRGLVDELIVYERNRKRYKTFDSFMPQVNNYFKKTAKEINLPRPSSPTNGF